MYVTLATKLVRWIVLALVSLGPDGEQDWFGNRCTTHSPVVGRLEEAVAVQTV